MISSTNPPHSSTNTNNELFSQVPYYENSSKDLSIKSDPDSVKNNSRFNTDSEFANFKNNHVQFSTSPATANTGARRHSAYCGKFSSKKSSSNTTPNLSVFDSTTNSNTNNNKNGNSGPAAVLSRKFVARRISEGETGRLKEELKCEACGKGYKHITSLAKHLWEHTPEWNTTSKLLISKHQQVQLLEAASILVSINEPDNVDGDEHSPSNPAHLSDPVLISSKNGGESNSQPFSNNNNHNNNTKPGPSFPPISNPKFNNSYISANIYKTPIQEEEALQTPPPPQSASLNSFAFSQYGKPSHTRTSSMSNHSPRKIKTKNIDNYNSDESDSFEYTTPKYVTDLLHTDLPTVDISETEVPDGRDIANSSSKHSSTGGYKKKRSPGMLNNRRRANSFAANSKPKLTVPPSSSPAFAAVSHQTRIRRYSSSASTQTRRNMFDSSASSMDKIASFRVIPGPTASSHTNNFNSNM